MTENGLLNLKLLAPENAVVIGPDLAIKSKIDGYIYLTSKKYIDKLFKLMGYKNLNVIKILEEYANKTVRDIGDLCTNNIYIDNITDSFIITTDKAIKWSIKFYETLSEKGYTIISERVQDSYYSHDEVIVESPTGTRFAIYFDFLKEKADVMALHYTEDGVLDGAISEGDYLFDDGDVSLNSLFILMDNPVDISYYFKPEEHLSIFEVTELLRTLGYVKFKKKKNIYNMMDIVEENSELYFFIETILSQANGMSWINKHITDSEVTFIKGCSLISDRPDIPIWSFKLYFEQNANEKNDLAELKAY